MIGGTFVSYVLRVNLNIAIVTMTNNSDVLCVNRCSSDSVQDEFGNIVFCWSEKEKGLLLGGYFYGYIALQIFGGSLAEKFGSKLVLGGATIVGSIISMLIPIASNQPIWLLFAMRVFQGLFAGVTFP